jgi:O-antigen/teichoic acid export membrane protein
MSLPRLLRGGERGAIAVAAAGARQTPLLPRVEVTPTVLRLAGTLTVTGILALLGLASGAVTARVLGPGARGELALLLLWPQLFCTVGNLGIDLAATYFSADAVNRDRVGGTAIAIALAQGAVLAPAYLLAAPILYASHGVTLTSLLMAALIPLYLVGAYCAGALSGRMEFGAFNAVRLATPLLYTIAIVALAGSGHLSASAAALSFLAANGAADVLAVWLLWCTGGIAHPNLGLARAAGHFGARAHFGRLTPQALGIDTIVVAMLLSQTDLGLFVAAAAFLAAPRMLTASISMVVFPQISAAHQAGAPMRLRPMLLLYSVAAVAPALMLVVGAGPAVHILFGEPYAGAVPVLRLLALSSLALSLRAFPTEVLRGAGYPGVTSVAEALNWVMFVAAVGCGALAGLEGVAAGVVAASVGSLAVTAVLAMRSGVFEAPASQQTMKAAA